jgi:hypothetical protein
MESCDDAAALAGGVMGIRSPTFVQNGNAILPPRGGLLRSISLPVGRVSSGVYYFQSEALARQYLAAPDDARFAACLDTVASNQSKTVTCEGSKVAEPESSDPHLSTLPASLPGVRTYGLRLAVHSACGAPGRSESFEDFLSFVRGEAVITLNAFSKAHPFPAASERRILARLYRRARAHSL